MKFLFDAHMHVFSLARPCLGVLLDGSLKSGIETMFAQMVAPEYLLMPLKKQGTVAIRNMLSIVENDPAACFKIIEDDLIGVFLKNINSKDKKSMPKPIIKSNVVSMFSETFDAWFLCPLIMDFGAKIQSTGAYYSYPCEKSIDESVREMLTGISGYRQDRPKGKLFIRPFLGIDPGSRGIKETERILNTYFKKYKRSFKAQNQAFTAIKKWNGDMNSIPENSFAGIKLYPPLGFDPWPRDKNALKATKYMYEFCEENQIPLTVHCDDEGFRTAELEDSLLFTNPERWEPVLAAYPELIINFGHFGERYIAIGASAKKEWTNTIIRLMSRYPNVYADVSFNGCELSYWKKLGKILEEQPLEVSNHIKERLMFGTDFLVNLSKVRSYLDYVNGFVNSDLDKRIKKQIISVTPRSFFFGE